MGTLLNDLPHRGLQLLCVGVIQPQAFLAHRRDRHAVVRGRAGGGMLIEALFGAPTGIIEAEEGNRSVHHVFFLLSTPVQGGVVREILECERHVKPTRAQACLFDELGALGGALRLICSVDWTEFGCQCWVGGDGLAQVGPHGRMLSRIEAEHTRDLIAVMAARLVLWSIEGRQQKCALDGLFEIADALESGRLIVIDVVIVFE